jgi:AcrR family transcriptional regulator
VSDREPAGQRPRGTYPKGVARRQEILDAAIVVFAERGGGRTSLRAIAQEVGVSHAALIHHFGSLERLLVEVYEAGAKSLSHAEPDPDGASPVEIMRLSAERNHSVPGMVELYSTLVASALEDGHPEATAYVSERFSAVRAKLVEQIRDRQAAGRIRADVDPAQVAALVVAASDGLQTQWLLDPDVDLLGALALLERLLAGDAAT